MHTSTAALGSAVLESRDIGKKPHSPAYSSVFLRRQVLGLVSLASPPQGMGRKRGTLLCPKIPLLGIPSIQLSQARSYKSTHLLIRLAQVWATSTVDT